jgi:hypothetical protein
MRGEQRFNTTAQRLVTGTGFIQVSVTLGGRRFLQGSKEDVFRR